MPTKQAPKTSARSASSSRTTSTRQPEILKLIKDEHDEVKKAFKQFEKQIESDPQAALATCKTILADLKLHTTLEEKLVYPDLKPLDEDLFHEANEEHHVADVLMGEIEQLQPEDPTFKAKMMVLRESIEHHVEEEEGEMFKTLKKADKQALETMASRWEQQKAMGVA